MKIAVIGAGAMGGVVGGTLAKADHEVTLVDVRTDVVDAINERGLTIEGADGKTETVRLRASARPAELAPVELVIVFVKCYHTAAAVRDAAPLIGPRTTVLSLQNGWGNGDQIGAVVGADKLLLGVSYHSATLVGPGHVRHSGRGQTFVGEPDDVPSKRLQEIADLFNAAGMETVASPQVRREIWSKLALNVCTLATSALLRFPAPELVRPAELRELMRALLREVVAVARPQGIALDFEERWGAITGLLGRLAPGAKPSMLQDVEQGRRTEIDVINGAVVAAGGRLQVPTPYNQAMVWLVRSLESAFPAAPGPAAAATPAPTP